MKKLVLFLALITVVLFASSQEFKPSVIANGGGKLSNTGIKMSYTIGEAVTGKISNSSVIFTEGFQQSSAGITVSVTEKPAEGLEIRVFPNPSKDLVNISFNNKEAENIIIQLIDINGIILLEKKTTEQVIETQVSLAGFAGNTYLLKISTLSGIQLGTFKIQKTN
jgi:hypothetical protein